MAARAMNDIGKELALGNLAYRWDGDDPEQFVVNSPEDIRAIRNGRRVAEIVITNEMAVVSVDFFDLIRDEYISDANPADYGVLMKIARDFKGDKEPDLIATMPIVQYPDTPRMVMPKQPQRRRFTIKGSLG
jgi:hypothetical protein